MPVTRRYYICKIVGDGKNLLPTSAFRPAIWDVIDPATGKCAFVIRDIYTIDKATGMLKFPWALVIAAGNDHTLANGSPDIDPLPVVALDTLLSSVPAATLNAVKTKLSARGVNVANIFAGATTYRQVLRALGRVHDAQFDESRLTV